MRFAHIFVGLIFPVVVSIVYPPSTTLNRVVSDEDRYRGRYRVNERNSYGQSGIFSRKGRYQVFFPTSFFSFLRVRGRAFSNKRACVVCVVLVCTLPPFFSRPQPPESSTRGIVTDDGDYYYSGNDYDSELRDYLDRMVDEYDSRGHQAGGAEDRQGHQEGPLEHGHDDHRQDQVHHLQSEERGGGEGHAGPALEGGGSGEEGEEEGAVVSPSPIPVTTAVAVFGTTPNSLIALHEALNANIAEEQRLADEIRRQEREEEEMMSERTRVMVLIEESKNRTERMKKELENISTWGDNGDLAKIKIIHQEQMEDEQKTLDELEMLRADFQRATERYRWMIKNSKRRQRKLEEEKARVRDSISAYNETIVRIC